MPLTIMAERIVTGLICEVVCYESEMPRYFFSKHNLVLCILLQAFPCSGLATESVAEIHAQFNPRFFAKNTDIARFEQKNFILPGIYRADIYLNQRWAGRRDIDIRSVPGMQETYPCFDHSLLRLISVAPPDEMGEAGIGGDELCMDITQIIPFATATFDPGELRLDVSVPQRYLRRQAELAMDPREWDQGINAGFLNYSTNMSRNVTLFSRQNHFYTSLGTGINLAGWRLRNQGAYSARNTGHGKFLHQWQQFASYAQHDITSLKSQFTAGEYTTAHGELLDSLNFTGVQIASDDRMLPLYQRGYAPVIRGVADTNALIRIRQGNALIHELTVAPGEYYIDDLYPGYAGDLEVTVIEADGRQKQFTVPVTAGMRLLRPHSKRYSLTLGRLRENENTRVPMPLFGQFSYQLGLENGRTIYLGATGSADYAAGLLGLAASTRWGAIAVDVAQSGTQHRTRRSGLQGRRWRVSYTGQLTLTRTTMNITADMYSSRHYMDLGKASRWRYSDNNLGAGGMRFPWQRLQLNLSQPLSAAYGSLYVNGSWQRDWDRPASDIRYYAGYSTSFPWGNLNLSLGRTRTGFGQYQTQFYVGLTLPLGQGQKHSRRPTLSSSISYHDPDSVSSNVILYGRAGQRDQFNYSTSARMVHSQRSRDVNIGAMGNYDAGVVYTSASASRGENYHQFGLSAAGSLLVHGGGLIAAAGLGDTIALVEAKNCEGATINGSKSSVISRSGYAVVPYLTPYQRNEVRIDPKGTSLNVEIDSTAQHVIPRAGAISKVTFSSTVGKAVLLMLTRTSGVAIPLGATVLNPKNGQVVGLVAQGGAVFSRQLDKLNSLTVRWGKATHQQCHVKLVLPAPVPHQSLQKVSLECVDTIFKELTAK